MLCFQCQIISSSSETLIFLLCNNPLGLIEPFVDHTEIRTRYIYHPAAAVQVPVQHDSSIDYGASEFSLTTKDR